MRLFHELVCNAIATVYFDGSLSHPVDPTFPTFQQKRRASCAAYIRFHESSNILGGRILSSCSSSTTSAEVEYEALILALEGLKQHWLEDTPPMTSASTFFPVAVLGDCKTVIQQMNGGARPRKMESLYKRASQAMEDIQSLNVQLSFQHIPRTQNLISDRLCSTMLAEKQCRDEQAPIVEMIRRELFLAPSADDGDSAPSALELSGDDCPPLIQNWMQEAAGTSVLVNDDAYWTSRVEPL